MFLFSKGATKQDWIPVLSKTESFSIGIVEPFTERLFLIKAFAKGKPNQPQTRMPICVIFEKKIVVRKQN